MFLKLENVSYTYMPGTPFEVKALSDISMEVRQGEILAVIGETGSGKSTLVQHCNGLLVPTAGKVSIDGKDVGSDRKQLAAIRRRVGLLFQFPEHQLFEESVYEDVAFGPKNLGIPAEEVKKRVEKALKVVGLDPDTYRDRSPFSLSGGQMRRVAMAGVLAMEPDALILDEPAAGLDPRGRREILSLVSALNKEHGLTVILVSHSMEDVALIADRLVVLSKGRIHLSGTPADVFAHTGELEQLGLTVPQITLLMHKLRQSGKDVPVNVFTVAGARDVILTMLGGGRHEHV